MGITFAPRRGFPGYTGGPLPRAIIMVGPDSQHCLEAILKARSLGPNGGLPLGEVEVLSNYENAGSCKPLTEGQDIPYLFKPAGKRYVGDDPSGGLTEERRNHMDWVAQEWQSFKPDLVILAKYMVVFEEEVLGLLPWRVVNVHHGILPAFVGRYALAAAIQSGADITGATFHYATANLDQGPTITQVPFPIDREDLSYQESVEALVRRNIGLMKEAEIIAVLTGLGFYLRGRLEFVPNEGTGRAVIPQEERKEARVRLTGSHGLNMRLFGDFPLLRAAWAVYRERTRVAL